MTLDERIDIAFFFRKMGFNCSQCMLRAFEDITNLSGNDADKISIGFGGGFGGQGEVCGVVSAMTIVAGYASQGSPEDKRTVYPHICRLCKEFEDNNGSLLCRTLKNENKKSCNELILNGIEILHKDISNL